MNTTQSEVEKSVDVRIPVAKAVAVETSEKKTQELAKQIERIASTKLRELQEREEQLHEEIDRLSSLESESGRMKAAQAELATVRAERAKRAEDLGSLSYAMAAEMESFGQFSVKSMEDSPEDIAMREKAQRDVNAAVAKKGAAEQRKAQAEQDLQTAKAKADLPWLLKNLNGRDDEIAAANTAIEIAEADIAAAEQQIEEAEAKLPEVEEQIKTNKAERLRQSSLQESVVRMGGWVSNAKNVLREDIGVYQQSLVDTKASLAAAVERRVHSSDRMRAAEKKRAELEVELRAKKDQQSDITDRTDPTFQRLETEIGELASELDAQNNEFKLAEGGFSDAEIAVKERRVSIDALTAQLELAKHQFNKFVVVEETARIIGSNIEILVKGSDREVVNESLDKGVHKMTAAVYDLSRKTQISSIKQLNDMAERKLELIKLMDGVDEESAKVLGEQVVRHNQATDKLRQTFKEQGIDADNLPGLQAAADLAQQLGGVGPRPNLKDELF